MAIQIEESIFLFFMGAIFIPLIGFMVKFIIDFGVLKGKIEQLISMTSQHDKELEGINEHTNKLNLMDMRLARLERESK